MPLLLDEEVVARALPAPATCVRWVEDVLTRKSECRHFCLKIRRDMV